MFRRTFPAAAAALLSLPFAAPSARAED